MANKAYINTFSQSLKKEKNEKKEEKRKIKYKEKKKTARTALTPSFRALKKFTGSELSLFVPAEWLSRAFHLSFLCVGFVQPHGQQSSVPCSWLFIAVS